MKPALLKSILFYVLILIVPMNSAGQGAAFFNNFSGATYVDGHRVYVKNNIRGPIYFPSYSILPTLGHFGVGIEIESQVAGDYYIKIRSEPPSPWNPYIGDNGADNESDAVTLSAFEKYNFGMGVICPKVSSYPTQYLVLDLKEKTCWLCTDPVLETKNIQLIVDADPPVTYIDLDGVSDANVISLNFGPDGGSDRGSTFAYDGPSGMWKYEIQYCINNNGNWTSIPGSPYDASKTSATFQGNCGNNYSFRIRGYDNVGNVEAYHGSLFVNLPSAPVIPASVSASYMTVCSGTPTTLSYSGGSGSIFRWYKESCDGTLVGSGNNLSVSPTSTTTYYGRWESNCGNSACRSVTITVTGQPIEPTSVNATSNSICSGNSTVLSYSGGSGTTFNWYSGSCGGTLVGSGNNLSVSPTSTTTYYGRWESSCGNSACRSVTITVTGQPIEPTSVNATSNSICSGNSTVLSYSGGSGTTFNWYSGSCGGTLVGSGNNLSVSPTSTTTYYGRWESSCGNSTCRSVTITVSSPITAPTNVNATSLTICSGNTTVLSYSGGSGTTFNWYSGSCGGTLVGSGNNLSVSPTSTTTYYGRWESICGNSTCRSVTITVSSQITAPTNVNATSLTICSGNSTVLSYSGGSGTTFNWYSGSCGGTLVGSGNNLSVSPTSTTTYYGRWESSCGNSTCRSVTITVSSQITAPTNVNATSLTICSGNSTVLSYSGGSGTTFNWYSGSCGGTLVGSGNNLSVSPTSTTTYYGRWESSCGNSTCRSVTITVSSQITAPTNVNATSLTICSGNSTVLSYSGGSGTTFNWYSGSCVGTLVGSGNNLSVSPTSTTTYYGRWESSCGNSVCLPITITVTTSDNTQLGPISGNTSVCQGTMQTYGIDAVPGASSYTWSLPSGWNGNSTLNSISTTIGTIGGNISVVANGSCGSTQPQKINVTVNTIPRQPENIIGNTNVSPGSSQIYSTSIVSGATSYKWMLPLGWNGSSQTNSINVIAGSNGGTISVSAKNSCGESMAKILSVGINCNTPEQPGSIAGNAVVCQGTSQIYSVSPVTGATSYTWTYPSGWNGNSTSNLITLTAGTNGGIITVCANNDCGSGISQSQNLSVNSLPPKPGIISGNSNANQGSEQTYSIEPVSGATFYSWTIPSGWTGNSSTHAIKVLTGSNSGTVAVTANNSCGQSASQFKSVTIADIPSITITSPSTSSSWISSTNHTISWNDNISENVNIYLYNGTTKILTIAESSPNNGSIEWTISNSLATSSNYRILIVSINSNSVFDYSDYFTISGNCYDAYEPNDDYATANTTVFTSSFGSSEITKNVSGTVFQVDDYDFYRINVTNTGTLTVNMPLAPYDYSIQLYDGNKKFLGYSKASDQTKSYQISSTGYYYIIVGSYPKMDYSCENYSLSVNWKPTSTPILQCIPSQLNYGDLTINTTSAVQSYLLSGSNLTGNVSITAPEGFQIATVSSGPFSNSVNMVQNNGSINSIIYVRFAPTEQKIYNYNISHSSNGASLSYVNVSGKGINCVDSYEPNDDYESANTSVFTSNLGTASINRNVSGTVYPADDYDYYRINITHAGTLKLSLPDAPDNYSIQLYDANHRYYGISMANDQPRSYQLSATGYYDIIVSSYPANDFSCSSYNLNVDWTPLNSCSDFYEPNTTWDAANTTLVANMGSSVYSKRFGGTIDNNNDVDFFVVNFTATGTLTATIDNPPLNLDLELYNSDYVWVTGSYNAGSENFSSSITKPGKYYLIIGNSTHLSSCDNYNVNLDWNPGTFCADPYEPNNSSGNPSQGIVDPLGTSVYAKIISSTIHASDDWDYYKIITTREGNLTIEMKNPPADFRMELWNADRNVVASSSTSGSEKMSYYIPSAGTYFLRVLSANGGFSCSNYYLDITWNPVLGQLISFNPIAGRTYGDPDFDLNATATSGLPVTYSSNDLSVATIVGNEVHITGAGECIITASQIGNSNYAPAENVTHEFAVNKAVLTAIAENKSRRYGAQNPALTVVYSGFVNNEDISVIDECPLPATSANIASDHGSYPITLSGGTDDNYIFSLVHGTFIIDKASISITAENKIRGYGFENPDLTIKYNGFVNNENYIVLDVLPTAVTTATITSNVGSYPITLSGGSDNNYDFNLINGNLTINKTIVTVTADNQTKVQGEENPEFTINYSGLLNGEDSSVIDDPPNANCLADHLSIVGVYPIIVTGGNDNNYDFEYVNGFLTISGNPTAIINITKSNVEIYPIPFSETLNLKLHFEKEGKIICHILDYQGKLIFMKSISFQNPDQIQILDLSSLPPGVYNLMMSTNNWTEVNKIVKIK